MVFIHSITSVDKVLRSAPAKTAKKHAEIKMATLLFRIPFDGRFRVSIFQRPVISVEHKE